MAEVEDNDPRRRESQGILALQLHSGPPTVVQFKDIRLKELGAATPSPKTSASPVEAKRAALQREAMAWWPLDAGGHGARPPLRHIRGWEKFELNVRAAGPGARHGADVVVLDGAYFDAGADLHGGVDAVTVYLGVRDPRGAWDSALFAKRGSHEQVHFNLFSADLPETPGSDIGFEIGTGRGFTMVSFPVSLIEAASWHDLVGRYDGKNPEIFCDGRRMAGKPWSGKLRRNQEPLLIGRISHMVSVANPGAADSTPAWFEGAHLQLWFGDVVSEADARQCKTVHRTTRISSEHLSFSALPGVRRIRSFWSLAIMERLALQP